MWQTIRVILWALVLLNLVVINFLLYNFLPEGYHVRELWIIVLLLVKQISNATIDLQYIDDGRPNIECHQQIFIQKLGGIYSRCGWKYISSWSSFPALDIFPTSWVIPNFSLIFKRTRIPFWYRLGFDLYCKKYPIVASINEAAHKYQRSLL